MPRNRRNCVFPISRHFSQFDRAERPRREARREKCTREQALTGSDFQLRVGSGRVVNLKVGLSGTLGSGSDKFSEVD